MAAQQQELYLIVGASMPGPDVLDQVKAALCDKSTDSLYK